jgi:hypothetical protein
LGNYDFLNLPKFESLWTGIGQPRFVESRGSKDNCRRCSLWGDSDGTTTAFERTMTGFAEMREGLFTKRYPLHSSDHKL